MFDVQMTEMHGECLFSADFFDELTPDSVFKLIDMSAKWEESHPSHKLLVDFSAATEISIDYEELKSIAQYIKENGNRKGKAAFVIGTDTGRIIFANLYIKMTESFAPGKYESFQYREDAITWLLS